jgi:hypothetical protein
MHKVVYLTTCLFGVPWVEVAVELYGRYSLDVALAGSAYQLLIELSRLYQ